MGFNIDEFQREAAVTEEKNILVVATPGAGKTTTLLKRVEYLLKEKEVRAKNIVVITFTKAAANNMKERFKRENRETVPPFFGTFHGLFYKILKNYGEEFNIIDTSKAYFIIKNTLMGYVQDVSDDKVKEILNAISVFKKEGFNQEILDIEFSMDIFHDCFSKYEDYKKKHMLYDFDDLQIGVMRLFMNNERILKGYQNLFKHILIDEFQDCDRGQVEIVKMLNSGNSVYAVGDEDQCIYGFRGSRPDYMVSFESDFDGGKKIFLENNYRNPCNVVEISNNLIKKNEMRNEKSLRPVKREDGIIEVWNHSDERQEIDSITERVIKLNGINGYAWNEIAILARTNMEITKVIDSFIRHRIPFRLLDKQYNFYDHFISKDIVSYLRLSIDPYNKEELSRVINKPFRYVSKVVVNKLKNAELRGKDAFEWVIDCDELHPYQIKSIEDLKKDIQSFSRYTLSSAVEMIIGQLGYYDYLREYCDRSNLHIGDFDDILEEFKDLAGEHKTILAFLQHIEEFREGLKENDGNRDGIILSTIHGVKGMEFKNVIIINCNEEIIPYVKSIPGNIEEERRLFYVAATRSSENLWLDQCRYIRNKTMEPSRFIFEMGLLKEKNIDEYEKGQRVKHISFGEGEITFVDKKDFEIKFDDNSTRRFDSMVLIKNDLVKKV